ncbi:MAG TPA: GH1 family beta-glucosidase [Acidobacteriaceae bacterium]|nr:GH1 family beta-glucosidase [Acidobacteriaceae bacterium]
MEQRINRRNFARLLGLSASAAALPAPATAAPPAAPASTLAAREFPKGFLWGTATSAYQIEGAPEEDGRGPSIWDTFSRVPKNTYTGDNGDIADDHFHRYREDVAIMRDLGVKTYQFSVSWSRIFPQGTGQPNPKGWGFYDRLLDTLLAAGIEPFCTLYHWDLPQAMMSVGGWQSRDTAKAFADYSAFAARHLCDRVRNFITVSEVTAFVDAGYRFGTDAPGLKLTNAQVAQVTHNVLLGHGLSVQAVRANARPDTRVGIADNAVSTCPVFETPEHIAAARTAYREENARSLTVILEGRYTELYLKALAADAPKFTPEDLKIISTPLDFIGLNIYEPTWIRASAASPGYETVDMPASYPRMAAGWLQFGPDGMFWSPKFLQSHWGVKEIYITENGAASLDVPTPTGEILDVDRVLFLRSYLTQLHRAIAEGVPVKGYFLWSLIDNYEWSDGYAMRFGITFVDYKNQKRTVKLSGQFYKEVVARNGLA